MEFSRKALGFNTQPPEGGCLEHALKSKGISDVSTHSRPKAAAGVDFILNPLKQVSTHSRPKAAADLNPNYSMKDIVSTHSRPKAAARYVYVESQKDVVSTHSRPKAAAYKANIQLLTIRRFNTQPPEGGCIISSKRETKYKRFQHTAARRRLRITKCQLLQFSIVSTHSRPKAAATTFKMGISQFKSFNTQPPEGGCSVLISDSITPLSFNTQPPEGGC